MEIDCTLLTVAYDPQSLLSYSKSCYSKSCDDQAIRMVDLKQADPNAKTILRMSTKSEQPTVDMTAELKSLDQRWRGWRGARGCFLDRARSSAAR